jgi:hypothetical protein
MHRWHGLQISDGIVKKRHARPAEFDPDQLAIGIGVEREHTRKPEIAMEIAMAHLLESPDYYARLERYVERDAVRLPPSAAHVYFYALPTGERFRHQGSDYVKLDSENVRDLRTGKRWFFEDHYGTLISRRRARQLRLPRSAYRPLADGGQRRAD